MKKLKKALEKFHTYSTSMRITISLILTILLIFLTIIIYKIIEFILPFLVLVGMFIIGMIIWAVYDYLVSRSNQCTFELIDDYDLVTRCVYESIVKLYSYFDLVNPSGSEVLKQLQNCQNRIVYTVYKNNQKTNTSAFVFRNALEAEINKSFQKYAPQFRSDTHWLFIDVISDQQHCYEFTLISVNDKTLTAVLKRQEYFRYVEQQSTTQGDDLYDEEL